MKLRGRGGVGFVKESEWQREGVIDVQSGESEEEGRSDG